MGRTAGILIVASSLLWTPAAAHAAPRKFKVVIDPGHGGTDMGTVYGQGKSRVAEKSLTLALAQETARELRKKGFVVLLTRDKDRELALPARTRFANRIGADVFVSIHMNSIPAPGAKDAGGVETYILNNTTDASSRRLAKLENAGLSVAGDAKSQEAMDIELILKDLRLDANLSESKRLACNVQRNLVKATARYDRGVKQALFYVLLGADMPSILVEAGFLSNARDRALVLSQAGRKRMAASIARSILDFRAQKGTSRALATLSRCKVH